MYKIWIFWLLLLLSLFWGNHIIFADDSIYKTNLSNQLILNEGDSVSSSIDKINKYNLSLLVSSQIEEISRLSEEKIWLEMHFGLHSASIKFEQISTESIGFIGIKYNLFIPKFPKSKYIQAKINKVNELIYINKLEISSERRMLLDQIEQEVKKYNFSDFQRVSVGVQIPFFYSYYDTYDQTFDNYYLLNNLLLFIGYDFNDYVTVSLAGNRKIMCLGVSLDVLTPTYDFVQSFFSGFRGLFGIKTPGSTYYL